MKTALKNAVKILLTAAFLLLCIIVPLKLFPTAPPNEPPPADWSAKPEMQLASYFTERAEIYDDYFDSRRSVSLSSIESEDLDACRKRIAALLPEVITDAYDDSAVLRSNNTGVYYIAGSGNSYIRVLEFYLEWTDDWKNWFFIAMDIDTQDIYYMYVSCNCENNFDYYMTQEIPYADDIIYELLPAYTGRELSGAELQMYDEEGRGHYTLDFGPETDPMAYEVNGFTTFAPESEVILYDYKIICKPNANPLK